MNTKSYNIMFYFEISVIALTDLLVADRITKLIIILLKILNILSQNETVQFNRVGINGCLMAQRS